MPLEGGNQQAGAQPETRPELGFGAGRIPAAQVSQGEEPLDRVQLVSST